MTSELLVEVRDGVGHLHLNRPAAINALTPAMMAGIHRALDEWRDSDDVESVELTGAGDRGLCSGADVRALRAHIGGGGDPVPYLAAEYAMNAAIAGYPKPYVAHLRGITMGGGLGVSAHGSLRLVYPDSRLAMPETIIGFVPDVGISWLLARAPGELGTHLALTGATVNATDAVLVGLADEVVLSASGDASTVSDANRDHHAAPTSGGSSATRAALASELTADRAWIDECYAGDDPVVIAERLEAHPDPRARTAGAALRERCPFSVAVALAAIRRAASLPDVPAVLAQDLILAGAVLPRPDFAEGVRAQLVDKDRTPNWQPARLEDVDPADVQAAFG